MKKLLLILIAVVLCGTTWSSTPPPPPIDAKSILDGFVLTLANWECTAEDTGVIRFRRPAVAEIGFQRFWWNNPERGKMQARCLSGLYPHCDPYRMNIDYLQSILLPNDDRYCSDWSYGYSDAACRQITGQPLVRHFILEAQSFYTPSAQFSATGLEALFNNLYVPPNRILQGHSYQQIYDVFLRDWMRTNVAQIAALLQHPVEFRQMATEFNRRAYQTIHIPFSSLEWCEFKTIELFGEAEIMRLDSSITEYYQNNPNSAEGYTANNTVGQWLGILLRRNHDGTLPTCLNLLRRVLRDYDPECYAQYGHLLVAP